MVEILTLWSPLKLLKNLGALSEYAKWSQNSTKIKKIEILTLCPGYDGMAQKTISRYCPFKSKTVEILVNIGVKKCRIKMYHLYNPYIRNVLFAILECLSGISFQKGYQQQIIRMTVIESWNTFIFLMYPEAEFMVSFYKISLYSTRSYTARQKLRTKPYRNFSRIM